MLTIKATGSIADMIASMRDVPDRLVPYAAATALTKCAQIAAKVDLPEAMRQVFDRPTPYALNSLFVIPARKDKLSARVMVKDQAASGVVPEKFLLPEVQGGLRNEKGFERALRYAGILGADERVMPGKGIELDAFGNPPVALIKAILAWVKDGSKTRSKKQKGQKQTNRWGYFLYGKPGSSSRGIAQRSGAIMMPLFAFVKKMPTYRARLDFEAIAEKCALDNFKGQFASAFAEMRGNGKL